MLAAMHIAFDPQAFSLQSHGGVSRYFFETAAHLSKLPDTDVRVLAFAHINSYLAAAPGGTVIGARVPVVPESTRRLLIGANRLLARAWLARREVDIVHETYYSGARTARRGVPTVLTVFDMIHEKFPGYAPRTGKVARAKRAAIERASHVVCISQNTRRDLLQLYGMDPARASVVTLGFSRLPEGRAHDVPAAPFVLFVGKRSGYKDFATLLQAYAGAAAVRRSHLLVCFGDAPFSRAELGLIDRLGVPRERVRHAAGDDAALGAYYRRAALFVYPSRYEGFGMPPLEAMSCDCPVVCSDAASLPEVVGDAARVFEAGNAEALRAALEDALGSAERSAELRRRGRERVKLFSWERCARETRAVYASLLR